MVMQLLSMRKSPWVSVDVYFLACGSYANGLVATREEKMPETSGIMSGKGVWAPKLAYATVFLMRHFVLLMPRAGFPKKEEAKPQFNKPGAKRMKLYYGPFLLPAVDVSIRETNRSRV
jgi:hypothetical protein